MRRSSQATPAIRRPFQTIRLNRRSTARRERGFLASDVLEPDENARAALVMTIGELLPRAEAAASAREKRYA